MITRQSVADKIAAWLHHDLSLDGLVDWAEQALMQEDFDDTHSATIAAVVGRLGTADVRSFGLSWEDCEDLLKQLGFTAHVEISAA
jgi:hypothetical protein